MAWPKLWVFVRHGESEGNVRTKEERVEYSCSTHKYPLTPRGVKQAEITGQYLREQFGEFDVHYTSYYRRAKQTLLTMCPDVQVYEDSRLAEAQRGIFHVLTDEQVEEKMPWEIERKKREGFYHYRPPGGENWADVEMRAHGFFGTIARDCAGLKVLTIVHGNWLILARKLIHHFSIEDALKEYDEKLIENTSVTVYSGVKRDGKSRLELADFNIVPWEGLL